MSKSNILWVYSHKYKKIKIDLDDNLPLLFLVGKKFFLL